MIILSPYARLLRNGSTKHPKNYPWWSEVVEGLAGHHVVQIGIPGEPKIVKHEDFRTNLRLDGLKELVEQCDTWMGVDSFFQHFCWDLGKPGVAIFSQSDPNIFGHKENINLLKSRDYLRPNQFLIWEQCDYIEEAFVSPEIVVDAVLQLVNRK